MANLRVHGVQFLADKKLRVHGVKFTGAPTTPTLRVHGVVFKGAAPLSLQPIADTTSEPFKLVTITAVPGATSSTPTGYQWQQTDGPTVSFEDNGSSITFIAPPDRHGTTVVFTVVALLGSTPSPSVTATVVVEPALWGVLGADMVWTPVTNMQLL